MAGTVTDCTSMEARTFKLGRESAGASILFQRRRKPIPEEAGFSMEFELETGQFIKRDTDTLLTSAHNR